MCDISNRDSTCPTGYCCVRDEVILEDILCKAHGRVNDICTTVVSESECPCLDGLYCKTVIVSSKFTSIYGRCHDRTADMIPTSTINSTIAGTSGQTTTTPVHNHPPVIHLPSSKIVVPKNTGVGHTIIRFSVSDSDSGLAGKVNCYIIHPPYFYTVRKAPHRFEILVLSSLQSLLPQTLITYIHCKDGGQHSANNVARLNIQITNEVVSSASQETTTPMVQSSASQETHALQSSASHETTPHVLQSSDSQKTTIPVLQTATSSMKTTTDLVSSASVVSPSTQKVKGSDPLH